MSLVVSLRNISQGAEVSDYEYMVLVGDGTLERSTLLESGLVKGHPRKEGWQALMDRFVNERKPNKVVTVFDGLKRIK